MHHAFKLGEAEHSVELSRSREAYRLHLGDSIIPIDLKLGADGRGWLKLGERQVEVVIALRGDDVYIHICGHIGGHLDGEAHQLRYEHPLDRLAAQAHGGADDSVRAPMPGSLVAVQVQAGDVVTRGQTLLVMESMKMETTITAPREGLVQDVRFEKGQTFERDAVLLILAPR